MGVFDDKQRLVMIGVSIGVGATLATRELWMPVREVVRSLTKAGIKLGLEAFELGREGVAHLREVLEDLVAEVQAERERDEEQRLASARRAYDSHNGREDEPAEVE